MTWYLLGLISGVAVMLVWACAPEWRARRSFG